MSEKRIALISFCVPTFNNVGAASALPYHLILGAKEWGNCNFEIWTFNLNNINIDDILKTEKELGVKIHLIAQPRWYKLMLLLHLTFLRILLHYPLLAYFRLKKNVVDDINEFKPDIVWIYGEDLAGLASCFPGNRRIVTMPDCETLYYHRVLATNFMTDKLSKVMRYSFAYWQYRSMDRDKHIENVRYHFVGEVDANFYHDINPTANVVFLPHPHYAWKSKQIKFHSPKIRLLFAGRYDYYCKQGSDELLNAMLSDNKLKEHYEVTFLGKGWNEWCDKLKENGWESHIISYAPDYIKELQKHDIQINAIDLGTGTKGKVLDAIANGLLEIGTKYALENIASENGKSCITYNNVSNAIKILEDIPHNINKYTEIAEVGRKSVLVKHNRKQIASLLFSFQTD